MEHELQRELIHAVALREGTARELSERFDMTTGELRAFTAIHLESIELVRETAEFADDEEVKSGTKLRLVAAGGALVGVPREEIEEDSESISPQQLDDLWITKKFERLKRYQDIAGRLIEMTKRPGYLLDATTLREIRSFMRYGAEELGQLLHRGSGEQGGTSVNYTIDGVDPENLR